MGLWCGWVFDTVTTRRWCVITAGPEDEARRHLEKKGELLVSPGVVIGVKRTIGTLHRVLGRLGDDDRTSLHFSRAPQWVPGEEGKIREQVEVKAVAG